ncbi:MAG: DUF488 family protein [Bacteroides sp.]|nr:DUF488 family protein [Bacteroides sp.]
MTQVKIKRVYEDVERSDGYRVLIDKLWPRGVKKEELSYSYWAKNIAPSTPLRKWFHEDEDANWAEFEKRYIQELSTSPAFKSFVDQIRGKKTVTLLFASKNAAENHALVLQHYLEKVLS